MVKNLFPIFTRGNNVQLLLYLVINLLFVFKYFPRYNINPYTASIVYVAFIVFLSIIINKKIHKIADNTYKFLFFAIILIAVSLIIFSLLKIDPYSIRVDRWSALSFFWDGFFAGKYPYGVHTHTCNTNFASPFPFWHCVNLPFYLLGDVGYQLIFFFILIGVAVYWFFSSYKYAVVFLIFLLLSPAYWWEVAVRSDGLSNSFTVVFFVLWYYRTKKSIDNNFLLIVLICGLFAATRFSALLPIALFLFKDYVKLSIGRIVLFPLLILLVASIWFMPFIFWDTENWVFFKRNPFMSQTLNSDPYVFVIMLVIGVFISLKWRKIDDYFAITSISLFLFMLFTQLMRMSKIEGSTFFGDAIVDISYFTLALPYCLLSITNRIHNSMKN